MVQTFLLNSKPIIRIFFLITTCFLLFFVGMVVFSDLKGAKVNYLYPVATALSLGVFCTLLIFFLELRRTYQENKFFNKEPYCLIEKLTIEKKYIKDKFSFYKLHRVFEIENVKYEAVFYSDVIKEIYGNALVIVKETNEKDKCILHIIDYKKRKFDKDSLLEELKNIKPA